MVAVTKRNLILLVLLLVLCVIGLGWYVGRGVFFRWVYDPAEASSPADITDYTSVPPPSEARDLRVAAFEYGQARTTLIRFSASVDRCRKYAATVMPNTPLKPLTQEQLYDDLMLLYAASREFHDVRWVDLPYAKNFWTVQSGKPTLQRPSGETIPVPPDVVGADENREQQGYLQTIVRVDVSRGVFYFLQQN